MLASAKFRIDPRLASLLGENYRSSEAALRELVDNAWDADADNVWVTVPADDLPNMVAPNADICVRDDGTGMTEQDVRSSYLLVARGRFSKSGEFTASKRRRVKGRKGIGKFAGLVMADVMKIVTTARSLKTTLEIHKSQLLASLGDLEEIDLPITVEAENNSKPGTVVVLSQLNLALRFPNPQKLRELLVLEYGQEPGFNVFVNGIKLVQEDLPGETHSTDGRLDSSGTVSLKFTIMEKPRAGKAGIIIRVGGEGGKVVGKPTFFGLDDDDTIPKKALNRIVGEIQVAGIEDAVTADWGAFLENNLAYQELCEWAVGKLKPEINRAFAKEVNLAKARRQKEINRRLSALPEHRRQFAERELDRIFNKYWTDADDKIDTMIALVLDAFEKDEYYLVCERLEEASHKNVICLAEALSDFGLTDMAVMSQQARRRLQFLDYLDRLAADPSTLEVTIHKALEKNLWVFGAQYSMISSNNTLRQQIEAYVDKKYDGERARQRPDLFLGQDVADQKLLIEFKRPNCAVGRDAESQAKKYRDDLTPVFGHMHIMIVGGNVDRHMSSEYKEVDLTFTTYPSLISKARSDFDWLMGQLSGD
jgi:hypothetical protein